MNKITKLIFLFSLILTFYGGKNTGFAQELEFGEVERWSSTGFYFKESLNSRKFVKDVDGDGIADAVVITSNGVYVRKSDGTKFLSESKWLNHSFTENDKVYIADVSGDGAADLIWLNNQVPEDKAYVKLSDGTSFNGQDWSMWLEAPNLAIPPYPIHFADVNGDQKKDLIGGWGNGIFVGTSTGSSFELYQWHDYCCGQYDAFGDVTGDGKADMLHEFELNDESNVWVNPSDGSSFGDSQPNWEPKDRIHVFRYGGDFNGDGLTDLLFREDKVMVKLAQANLSKFSQYQTWDQSSNFGNFYRIFNHIADVTGDGKDDVVSFFDNRIEVRRVQYKKPLRGVSLICNNDNTIYNIVNGESGVTKWNVSSNLMILSSNDREINIKPRDDADEESAYVEAILPNRIVRENIWIGKPKAYAGYADPICINQFTQENPYRLVTSPGAESYRLVSSSPYLTINGNNEMTYFNAPVDIDFISSKAGTYRVDLYTENECGGNQGAIYVTSKSCGFGFNTYSIYPNPTSSEVNIASNVKESIPNSTQSLTYQKVSHAAKLYDSNGTFIKTLQLDPYGITKTGVSNLKEGIYFLKVWVRKEEETYKIVVKH